MLSYDIGLKDVKWQTSTSHPGQPRAAEAGWSEESKHWPALRDGAANTRPADIRQGAIAIFR